MAEGGVAAALGNVDDRDNWKVHFADTMRGGQYLNNWRMAELHAKEAPDRVRELEAWGALFDRTKDGRILQRNFGGHRYPRLAHVGDRTGLEMIRTLQDHGIHQGIDVYMECTVVSLCSRTATASRGAFGYERERGRFLVFQAKAVVLATGGIGARLQDHVELVGVHRRRARARATTPAPSSWTWSSCSSTRRAWCGRRRVRGILVTEGVRGEGGVLRNKEGKRFMFDDIPENYTRADRGHRGGGLALLPGRQERAPPAGAPDARPRRALHHARGQGGARLAARRRLPRHRVDQGARPRRRRAHQEEAARRCTTSSRSWRTSTSRRSRWRSGRRRTT